MNEWGRGAYGMGSARVDQSWNNLIEMQRQREEQERREEQLRQQRAFEEQKQVQEARSRIAAAYMAKPSAQARAAALATGLFRSDEIPEYQMTPEEEYNRMIYGDATEAWKADPRMHGMAPGGLEAGRYQLGYGAAPPEAVAKSGVGVSTYSNQDVLPPEYVEAQRVRDERALSAKEEEERRQADRKFTEIEKPESVAGIGKTRAETGKIGVETTKIGEETITERESRDPNSPTSKAKRESAGRKSFSDQMADSLDRDIQSMQNSAEVYRQKLSEKSHKLDRAYIENRIKQLEESIAAKTKQRDILRSGRGEPYIGPSQPRSSNTGVPPSAPAPKKLSAQAPARYDANTEAALENVMRTLGLTREQAIAEAKRRGLIKK